MGFVYRARDTRLDREVALKCLQPQLTEDEDARRRFIREAKAASALDHPNICTIHAIDETADGELYIAMALYDGETLKKRIQRGPLEVEEALEIAIQVARGLEAAHEAGIVHRDIKPANLMIRSDGLVKILDFGVVKLDDATTIGPGMVGTLAYMSPEQIAGDDVDARTDVWALGVVLYEMLTGERPFGGQGVLAQVLTRAPQRVIAVRPDAPAEVEAAVLRAMQKDPGARFSSAREFGDKLAETSGPRLAATPRKPVSRRARASRMVGATLGGFAIVMAIAVTLSNRESDQTVAREVMLPQIQRLVEVGGYVAAFNLAEEAERLIPNDPALQGMWSQVSQSVSVRTLPEDADAEIFFADYFDSTAEWRSFGSAPIDDMRFPRGVFRFRVEAEGYAPIEVLRTTLEGPVSDFEFSLVEIQAVPPGMVLHPGGVPSLGFTVSETDDLGPTSREELTAQALEPYFIDRWEVTNRQFKEFIDARGYQTPEFWTEEFVDAGQVLTWDEAIERFLDSTRRPGPSTWSAGTYPEGEGDHPVSGVSWYEASAYAKFAGKSLPSAYHWTMAAGLSSAKFIVPASNLEGRGGTIPAGAHTGVSPFGLFDVAGNVREWTLNSTGSLRIVVGGAVGDPPHLFTYPNALPPLDRLPGKGFRTVRYLDGQLPDWVTRDLPLRQADFTTGEPASDEVFVAYRRQFFYDRGELADSVEFVQEFEHWRQEKVSFMSAYGERMAAYVFLPKNVEPPYQTVVFFPGNGALIPRPPDWPVNLRAGTGRADFIVQSGRAVVLPVYDGTLDRDPLGLGISTPSPTSRFRDYFIRWVQDFMRTVDYLETRDDLDTDPLGYFGYSWGATYPGIVIAAVDPRVSVAVYVVGGLAAAPTLPEVDAIHYVQHIEIPVLMVNGRHDTVFPYATTQAPMFDLLGTPEADRRHQVYDAGHNLMTRHLNQVVADVLDWLDRYMGPVR